MKIEELNLSVRAYHCLKRHRIDTVEQLRELTETDLRLMRGMGPKLVGEILNRLEETT